MKERDESAVDAMAQALLGTEKGTAWLIATGALTNVAMVFQRYPELTGHLKGLSIMGGAIGDRFTAAQLGHVDGVPRIGNWSPYAEFNILIDPEAAHSIFSNEVLARKTTLIPLDVTHLVLATKDVQELLLRGKDGKRESRVRRMLVELLTFFAATYDEVFGLSDGPPLHDPLAVAVVLDGVVGVEIPFYDFKEGDEKRKESFDVRVVTEGTHEDAQKGVTDTGRTVVRLLAEGEGGVKIPRGLDISRFWMVLEECLERVDEASKANGGV